MTARVAVFGTSRSGKDYTIRDASELLTEEGMLFSHVSPINMVHEELGGRTLRNMPDIEKKAIISEVRKRIRNLLKDEYVFVDEHYCFPETFGGRKIDNGYYGEKLPFRLKKDEGGRNYEVVFKKSWLKHYDLVIYMDVDPCVILDRFRSSEGDKNNPYATYDDICFWQMFEINHIEELCQEYQLPLYYVYDPDKSGEELATIVEHHFRANNSGTNSKTDNQIMG